MIARQRPLVIAGLCLAVPLILLAYIGKAPESASGVHADFIFTGENQQNPQPLRATGKEAIATNFIPLAGAPARSGTLTNLVLSQKNGRTRALIFVRNTALGLDLPGTVYGFSTPSTSRNIYLEVIDESGKIYTASSGRVSVTGKKGKFVTLDFKEIGFEDKSGTRAKDSFKMSGTLVYFEKDIQARSHNWLGLHSISQYPVTDAVKTPAPPLLNIFLKQ